MDNIYVRLMRSWNGPYVPRSKVGEFTGGLVAPKTVANADSEGTGPKERVTIGSRKVGYPTEVLAEWVQARAVEWRWDDTE